MILFWDIWKKNEGSKEHEKYWKCEIYVKYTSIKELNSLGTPWGPESIRKCYNVLKQYFPTYLKVPRSIERFSLNIFGDLWGGEKLVPVLV